MKYISYIALLLIFTGCELFTIGSKLPDVIPVNQESAIGSAFLFKAGLDSNNVYVVTQILTKPDGNPMLADEKYSKFEEIERFFRLVGNKVITNVTTDSITSNKIRVDVEFDYLKSISFTSERINKLWYIVSYTEYPSIIYKAVETKTSLIKCR